ncbi:MAG: hypothetical protein DI598_02900 [Pseudopedobacter saltans]|uniref:Uncharacterized protein n=1 Tax=Pseudopedobacter saltans TaxID=151895 RepID=A0A2W5F810_9SPHI|nr:MAG: hypothetical protein DI598_02900 [Pseudopedobacter saltans]
MKKNFPMLLLRIGGLIALLSIAAFVLMTVVKLLITTLFLVAIGGLAFKMVRRKRQQMMLNERYLLPVAPQRVYNENKIQPIYNKTNSSKTIIPIL